MMCVCGRGLSLEFITSAVCAFQSTNRPQVAAGVYFQGSLAVIPFTFVIAQTAGAYNFPSTTEGFYIYIGNLL